MWVIPDDIRPKSILKYFQIKMAEQTIRWMAVDEVSKRYWLIHDSGWWCEG
jgi:hypothetical protein